MTTLYQGEPRPLAAGAVVESKDSVVDEIDGRNVQAIRNLPTRYVLPPGPHVIGFSVSKSIPGFFTTTTLSSDYLRVCLLAKPGHRYVTAPIIVDDGWAPRILDIGYGYVGLDCDRDRLFPERANPAAPDPRAGAALSVIPPPATDPGNQATSPDVPASVPTTAGNTGGSAAGNTGGSTEDSSRAPLPSPPESPGTTANDAPPSDSPKTTPIQRRPVSGLPATVKLWSSQSVKPLHARPFIDIMLLNMGASLGGETIATVSKSNGDTEKLTAGQGVSLGLGVMVTPIWLRDTIGLGLSGEIGLKYDDLSASNGDLSFMRYPAVGTMHALIRTGDRWFFLVAGGVEKHLSPTLAGSLDAGMLDVGLKSRLGGLGRIGMYTRTSDYCAITFGVGYASVTYDLPADSLDGSSVNFWMNVMLAAL